MSYVFWRPVKETGQPSPMTKRMGRGLYELWSRCDLCGWSGPNLQFAMATKDGVVACLCPNCGGDDQVVGPMLAEGWVF